MATATKRNSSFGRRLLERLGAIGKVLMFPVAVLPVAAILLRIGAEIPGAFPKAVEESVSAGAKTFLAFVQKLVISGGDIIFGNLPVLFAISIGFGFTRDNRGEAAFAAFISMMLLMALMSKGGFVDFIYGNFVLPGAEFNKDGSSLKSLEFNAGATYDANKAQLTKVLEDLGKLKKGVVTKTDLFAAWNYNAANAADARLYFAQTIGFAIPDKNVDKKGYEEIVKLIDKSRSLNDYFAIYDKAGQFSELTRLSAIEKVTGDFELAKGFTGVFGGKYDAILSGNVLNGIIVGFITAVIYNNFKDTKLPKVLSFFSGRRYIPAVAVLLTSVYSILYALIFPWIGYAIYGISIGLTKATGSHWGNAAIMGVYGFINRLLIPFGLHHIPNNLFWFQLGEHVDGDGAAVFGDIFIFLKGAAKGNHAGTFQAGFFPMMMFGLPALVAAFWATAEGKEQKQRVIALYGSAALISFLSGITEPIEFAFMFVSPLLYLFHAVLTGIFAFITGAFGIQLGFGFSAGVMDYIISIPKSMSIIHENKTGFAAVMANPAWIFVIGAACAAAYFFVGFFTIKGLKLETPGRGANKLSDPNENIEVETFGSTNFSAKSRMLVEGFGGWDNITKFGNCATRLRYEVEDMSKVNDDLLRKGGAQGIIKLSEKSIQVIIGTEAESVNGEIESNQGQPLR